MSIQHGSGPPDCPAIGQPHQDAGHPPRGTGHPPWGAGRAPWDVGQPQPALAAVAGAIRGRVLDVGCGTGEHTLMAAARGLDATGIDLSEVALRSAREKARERGLAVRFRRHDALRLAGLREVFDTVLDSLVLHAFDAADQAAYLGGVRTVLRPGGRLFVLGYSDRQPAGQPVPHGLSRPAVESCFTGGWDLESLQPATCSSNLYADGVAGWLATVARI
ncbi:MAG TPA: class I SAM-dependent methyltransferase [Streptosporangiaceae bacterium]|nr:class I SAM-dependent methyltransferase [Streptosporangiaceae bacterium]